MRSQNELADVERALEHLTFGAARLEPPAPAGPRPSPLAFKRIVVAVDGTAGAALALDWARRLGTLFQARVAAVHVVPPPDVTDHYLHALGALAVQPPGDLAAELEQAGRRTLDAAGAELRTAGLEADAVLARGRAAPGLVAAAADHKADLVILGSHGRGILGRTLLGSVADAVKERTAASVLLAKTPAPGPRLLLATDGSRSSKRAVALGIRLAHAWKLPATVLHVLEPPAHGTAPEAIEALRRRAFGRQHPGWTDRTIRFELEFGDPAERILARTRDTGPGLVVMGSRGLSGLGALAAGSVSDRVAHHAPGSVLLVKEGAP